MIRVAKKEFVETRDDIIENIKTLEDYREIDKDYWEGLIRRGYCFIIAKVNNRRCFSPSKFTGYYKNCKEEHERKKIERDGRLTNVKIDKILGKHSEDETLESEFLEFCRQNGIEPSKKEKVKRKYWDQIMK